MRAVDKCSYIELCGLAYILCPLRFLADQLADRIYCHHAVAVSLTH